MDVGCVESGIATGFKTKKMATKDLENALRELNKEFGSEAVNVIGTKNVSPVEAIPTGCFSLDYVFGCGGIPRGRIIEIYGEPGSGKSTVALFLAGVVQRMNGTVLWVDAEQTFSQEYAKDLGVDVTKLVLNQPSYGEEGLEIVRRLAEKNVIDIAIVDSVAALVPKKELDGEIRKEDIALQARMMSKALRMMAGIVKKSKMAVIFINQTRSKVGVFYGMKEDTPGGKALKFNASVRLEVRRGKSIKAGEDTIGNEMVFYAAKNKVGMPFRKCMVDLYYGKGIDTYGDILETGLRMKILERSGSAYKYKGESLGAGKEAAKKTLLENKETYDKILNDIKNYDATRDNATAESSREEVETED